MDWTETTDRGTTRWTREDGTVVVALRETADTRWAVTLDRLEQAPEGPGYERETVPTRADALAVAARWREEHDGG
ncbi:DUF7543 family protein [Halomarina pelagica]|uniref:DUF7543 family protein n=1 Tax=Halomarina pelagica TaxID=2961599 RepID=UPI0020C2FD4E|nr:hypothetical protein [Halomarina sp. BND7]